MSGPDAEAFVKAQPQFRAEFAFLEEAERLRPETLRVSR